MTLLTDYTKSMLYKTLEQGIKARVDAKYLELLTLSSMDERHKSLEKEASEVLKSIDYSYWIVSSDNLITNEMQAEAQSTVALSLIDFALVYLQTKLDTIVASFKIMTPNSAPITAAAKPPMQRIVIGATTADTVQSTPTTPPRILADLTKHSQDAGFAGDASFSKDWLSRGVQE